MTQGTQARVRGVRGVGVEGSVATTDDGGDGADCIGA
jgi:hypothetical protein